MNAGVTSLMLVQGATVRDAIEVIDSGARQVALIVDETCRLMGVVTDGDIRRSLLRGATLESPVEIAMNSHFVAVSELTSGADAALIMQSRTLHHLPVVDGDGRLVGCHSLDDFMRATPLPNSAVVMAGGRGKRLSPLTNTVPKPMLPIGGRPMLELVLERCISAGIQDFHISVGHLSDQIRDYFGDGRRWNVSIRYLMEEQPLGTAGALHMLRGLVADPVLVMNADVLTKVDFRSLLTFHGSRQAFATVCARSYDYDIPFGVLRMSSDRLVSIDEKPRMTHRVSAGVYVLDPKAIELVPSATRMDMPELLQSVLAAGRKVSVFPLHEDWLDVGDHEALAQAIREWT